jgi:hypothetical protein
MIKLMMSWNIRPGFEDEWFEFIIQEFGPGLHKLGIQPTDTWCTTYGDCPQILTGGVAKDLESLQYALGSDKWLGLKEKLLDYVTDYRQKVIPANGGFQL